MGTSPLQAVYATNLQQNLGYPLRTPEPIDPNDNEGLRIGDVGFVNDNGDFNFLFNIRFPPDGSFQVPPYEHIELKKLYTKPAVFSEDYLLMTGVQRDPNPSLDVAYKFTATSGAGAILVLPSGATLSELQNKQELEELRKIATKYAEIWCEYTGQDSLYLVTGVYKTSSWTLGSFNKGRPGGEIIVERQTEKPGGGMYKWKSAHEVDYRTGLQNNQYENQTVVIKGFKMTSFFASFITLLLALLSSVFIGSPKLPSVTVAHDPPLSQPLHPLDLINQYLLGKNSKARVAITHDDEWIYMLEKGGLSHSDLMQERPLREFLARTYDCHSDDGAVYLQSRMSYQSSIDIDNTDRAYDESGSSQPAHVTENVRIVVTPENLTIGLGHIPIGFYVQFESHDGTSTRTNNKSASVCEPVIQWDEPIQLRSSDPSVTVRLTIYGSFEFAPVLGKGERLFILDTTIGDLLDKTGPIILSERDGEVQPPCASLFIAVQQWHCDYRTHAPVEVDSNLYWDDSSELAKETDLGYDALGWYRSDHCKKYLESSVAHFKRALDICPDPHLCRAAVLSNLARVTFIVYQFDGMSPNSDRAIELYQEALKLRREDHPDRPTTLLHLSQTLLYRYGAMEHIVPIEAELKKLVEELTNVCPENRHERRAADLVLLSYERFRLWESGDLAELDRVIAKLELAVQEPPEAHFDMPIWFNNLGLALLRRFQLRRNLSDLHQAITWLEESAQTTRNNNLDKPDYLSDLGNALLDRFQLFKHDGDLDRAIRNLRSAADLTPDQHRHKRTYVDNYSNALLTRFQRQGNVSDLGGAILGFEQARGSGQMPAQQAKASDSM